MRLSKAIRTECLLAKATFADKAEALAEAADLAKRCRELDDVPVERVLRGFEDREALSSTGIGNGIAIPHCRIPNVRDFIVGVITLDRPIEFDSIDGQPVAIVAFIVGPESNTVEHPRILSGLSLRLNSPEGRAKLLAATTSQELLDALSLSQAPLDEEQTHTDRRLVHAIVQDGEIFDRVLEAFESIEGATTTVLESNNARKYLAHVPVFASFLADSPTQFSRMVLATVPKALTNETLRRIESVTGRLDDRNDVAVIVQDVFLMAGTLGV
jgi:PTS system nitrogen regulatory IIA component